MAKATWVKWKDGGGPRVRGENLYDPPGPLTPMQRVLGVVARCEGAHDTVVMYDETGVTFGFMQWTFTSGRLQKFLESLKSIPCYDFDGAEDDHDTLFDVICCDEETGCQKFEQFGFRITGGKFVWVPGGVQAQVLDPRKKAQKKKIVDICMGRVAHPDSFQSQKRFALRLARLFADMGCAFGMAAAQAHFAEQEFSRQMQHPRSPLGGATINDLVMADQEAGWSSGCVALFLNLWQNNPAAAYRLFQNSKKRIGDWPEQVFVEAWKRVNRSKFGNWGWGKPENKTPRVVRIKQAFKEFYERDLSYYK